MVEGSGGPSSRDGIGTRGLLARITDAGLFERLANAVLREEEAECRRLVETGVNEEGRTVRGPLDGVAYVVRDGSRRMLAVHHTTCGRNRLRDKWLGAEDGDLAKTGRLLAEHRKKAPYMEATLILTTNKEPAGELMLDLERAGREMGVEIKVWPGSALAHFLDVDGTGQWIRKEFLGVNPARLSERLLRELCQRSLGRAPLAEDRELWVGRELERELAIGGGVRFIVGESGVGKTVACVRYLQRCVDDGAFGLVLADEALADSATIEEAVCRALRDLQPSLSGDVGNEALALASDHAPLIVLAEDVNRSPQPARLVEQLANWGERAERAKDDHWRMLCPVWPRTLALVGDRVGKLAGKSSSTLGLFSGKEGVTAVKRRRPGASDVEAKAVASALGFDPLLIALHGDEEGAPNAGVVIQSYIERAVVRLAESEGSYAAGEYRMALRTLALEMVERRRLEPDFSDVVAWVSGVPGVAAMLRKLTAVGDLVRLAGPVEHQRVAFRHDRVRDHLLADAVAQAMSARELSASVVAEPYFAEIIGQAAVRGGLQRPVVDELAERNPLALICALRYCSAPLTGPERNLVGEAIRWAESEGARGESKRALRSAALRVLAGCDGTHVKELCGLLDDDRGDVWSLRGHFRNGDILAGVRLCAMVEPGVGWVGHVELIEHVVQKSGSGFDAALEDVLLRSDLPEKLRRGALRLAGYVGSPALGGALRDAWLQEESQLELLSDYLWACARCCGEEPSTLLKRLFDAWAGMSDERERHRGSPRSEFGEQMRRGFRDRAPQGAIRYFLERAEDPGLRWPVTWMLHGIDHPDAVEFVVREIARMDMQSEIAGGVSPFGMTAMDEWRWRQQHGGRPMSALSRARLREIWSSGENGKHLRRRALRFWSATEDRDDVAILQAVETGGDLGSVALFERLRRGDLTATPELVEKLQEEDPVYWWQAGRHIWTDELTDCLDRALGRRSTKLSAAVGNASEANLDWMLSERLAELPPATAEGLLLRHWEGLRHGKNYVQVALYVASPGLLERVATVVGDGDEPERLFEHLSHAFGLRVKGRRGITRWGQMEGLLPYLAMLSDRDIEELWRVCNENRWFDWRREHVDVRARLADVRFVDDVAAVRELDRDLDDDGPFFPMDHWGKDYLGTGVSVDHMMAVVERWLADRPQEKALLKAADIVIGFGKRRHVEILRRHVLAVSDFGKDVIRNTKFDVRLRSLE